MPNDSAELVALKRRVIGQEAVLREHHLDYTETLGRAGIWAATQIMADGIWADPFLATEIYSAPDPPKRAYRIAREILSGMRPPPELRVVPINIDIVHAEGGVKQAGAGPLTMWQRVLAAWRIVFTRRDA